MFGIRLSKPFQNLCSASRTRTSYSVSSRTPRVTRPFQAAFKPLQTRSTLTSITGFTGIRSASTFTYNASSVVAKSRPFVLRRFGFGSGIALSGLGLGLGFAAYQIQKPAVLCEAPPTSPATALPRSEPTPTPKQPEDVLPPPPRSSLNMLELGFGTVAGICAGVFIKKGAKALAFVLGGVFVLLQYLVSIHLVRVDWSRAESSFQDAYYSSSKDAAEKEIRRPPTVYSLFRWIIDFLTADFPPRATFIAGMALGLRLG